MLLDMKWLFTMAPRFYMFISFVSVHVSANVSVLDCVAHLSPLLLTWFSFNLSMDK